MCKSSEVEKLANVLEEILKKSPCVFSYIEGYIDCFLQKKTIKQEVQGQPL